MPVETIKCQECGSADVTEFKAGSYVCGHCGAVFKHVAPAGVAVGCQIEGCGVLAIGRCRVCKRAFCGTHQARDYEGPGAGIPRSDVCMACATEARAARAQESRRAIATPTDDARSIAINAAALLMDAGGLGLQRRVGIEHKPSAWTPWSLLMGRRSLRPVEIELDLAWPVGTYGWCTRSEIVECLDTGLTPNGEIVPMGGPSYTETRRKPSGGTIAMWLVAPSGETKSHERAGEAWLHAAQDGTWQGPVCSWPNIAAAMEQLIIQELGANGSDGRIAERELDTSVEPA